VLLLYLEARHVGDTTLPNLVEARTQGQEPLSLLRVVIGLGAAAALKSSARARRRYNYPAKLNRSTQGLGQEPLSLLRG